MKEPVDINRAAALFLARVLLGLIFFWQGFHKVFVWGVEGVYERAFQPLEATFLPGFVLWGTAYFTSWVELLAGGLLILGVARRAALYALGLVLLVVSFGHGLQEGIWDLHHVLFRGGLVVFLLWTDEAQDRWQLERLWKNRRP